MIENTGRRDPLLHLAGAWDDPGRYITDMESDGQRQLVHSDRLPTDMGRNTVEEFEALGFKLGDPDPQDPLFRPATLPEGWSREGSDHAMWSSIVDQNGRQRVAIFYKAAFYDRSAHMRLCTIGNEVQQLLWSDEDEPQEMPLDDWTPRDAWIAALTEARDRELGDAKERDSYFPVGATEARKRAAKCDALLKKLGVSQ
jgi:hypothetical protein